jgi:signal transduction histidine kinase
VLHGQLSMGNFLTQLFTLFTTLPGNLIYHIVLLVSIAGTMLGAVQFLRSSQFPQARRIVFGLAILLGLQVILFFFSGLTLPGWLDPARVLPPLERAVTLLSLIWIAWLWAFPEPLRLADFGVAVLSVLVLVLCDLTLALWTPQPTVGFNGSIFEKIWQSVSLVIALLGLGLLVLRKPNGWSSGMVMLGLASLGHLFSLAWPLQGNFPGAVRLSQIILFPILLAIVHRFPVAPSVRKPFFKTIQPANHSTQDRQLYNADPETFQALMTLAAETSSDRIGPALTRAISHAMVADLVFLIVMAEDKSLSLDCGYDLIREGNLEGTTIHKQEIPLLAEAIQRGRSLRLPASSTSTDLKGLSKLLGLSSPGHLLSVPIVSDERGSLGCILLLSPYSNRSWGAEDQAYLSDVSSLFLSILERGNRQAYLRAELDKANREAQAEHDHLLEAQSRVDVASRELEDLRQKVSQSQLQAENIAALVIQQDNYQKTIESLNKQIEQLRLEAQAASPPADAVQMERELHQALEELARMQNALAEANKKLLKVEHEPVSSITGEQLEDIYSIAQELRQPMSSIIGYTDLLLGESVGILGALQRKFVERIKVSTERIGDLADDLIQITNLETGKLEFTAESIDLNNIIDKAIAYTGSQIREKNITLRLDIPDVPPPIQTDRDAIQQIFIHLLENATAATQVEGIITLRVQLQTEADKHFVSIQVTDSGGGIPSEDIPRVFARRYRAEHSRIQGL